MGKRGFFGRIAHRLLNQQGLMMLYCGYAESHDPVPDFTFKKRRVILPPTTAVIPKTEQEVNNYIASWTMLFAGWPVPLDAMPLDKSEMVDEPLGGIGIITSTIVGVAVHHAGNSGKTFIVRIPTESVIPVPQWSLSAVEFAHIILHQIPREAIVGEVPKSASALAALPPFGHLGIPGGMARLSPPAHPARFYRDATRQVCVRYQPPLNSGTQDDAHFLSYLEQRYQEEKEHIARLKHDGLPKQEEPLACLGLLMLAVGLFTYGRLDVVDDILNSIPPPKLRVGRLAWCLHGMLPLPDSIGNVQQDTAAVKTWFDSHKAALQWDETRGVYTLR